MFEILVKNLKNVQGCMGASIAWDFFSERTVFKIMQLSG